MARIFRIHNVNKKTFTDLPLLNKIILFYRERPTKDEEKLINHSIAIATLIKNSITMRNYTFYYILIDMQTIYEQTQISNIFTI